MAGAIDSLGLPLAPARSDAPPRGRVPGAGRLAAGARGALQSPAPGRGALAAAALPWLLRREEGRGRRRAPCAPPALVSARWLCAQGHGARVHAAGLPPARRYGTAQPRLWHTAPPARREGTGGEGGRSGRRSGGRCSGGRLPAAGSWPRCEPCSLSVQGERVPSRWVPGNAAGSGSLCELGTKPTAV